MGIREEAGLRKKMLISKIRRKRNRKEGAKKKLN